MKNCKTCEYFTRVKDAATTLARITATPDYVGVCSCRAFVYLARIGRHPNNGEFEYWDGEGWTAGFSVTELFGCVHHKEREL
jgi:hypothetical protein